jgi:hypothetical protein
LKMCYFQFYYMTVWSTRVAFYSRVLFVCHSSRAHSEKQVVVCRPTIFLFQLTCLQKQVSCGQRYCVRTPCLPNSVPMFFSLIFLSSRNDDHSLNATTTTSHIISAS